MNKPDTIKSPESSGSKQQPVRDSMCWNCNGSGKERANVYDGDKYTFYKTKCTRCNGSGYTS